MRPVQLVVWFAGEALLLLTLAGLWKRRRMRRLWLLPVHLVGTAVAQMLAFLAPHIFLNWRFWAWRETVLHGVTLGIVVEIALRVFSNLPEGRKRAWRLLGFTLLLPLGLLLVVPWHHGEYASATWLRIMVLEVLPRLSYGAGFLCLALGFAMALNLVPFDRLHWPVLLGLGCYLFIYAIWLGTLPPHPRGAVVEAVGPVAYTLMLAWWAWAAWRHEKPDPRASERARRFLQPWLD